MAGCCGDQVCTDPGSISPKYRKALWIALFVNAAMFAVEIVGGMRAGSMSLFADSLDFAGDAANYGISLAALSMGILWRSRAAWLKGFTMMAFGFFIVSNTLLLVFSDKTPEPITMGFIGLLALLANAGVALMLYAFRDGDANMRSVWLCSRNDAIGNIAVMFAALGVFGTGQSWPDLVVAAIMATLALSSGWQIIKLARQEIANHSELGLKF